MFVSLNHELFRTCTYCHYTVSLRIINTVFSIGWFKNFCIATRWTPVSIDHQCFRINLFYPHLVQTSPLSSAPKPASHLVMFDFPRSKSRPSLFVELYILHTFVSISHTRSESGLYNLHIINLSSDILPHLQYSSQRTRTANPNALQF